jgi:murein DD-endopeptidase MepM/ murein hydrolase activator NlpD
MQYAYEERIAALRSELDRMTSRHIVQTEGVEQQLTTLLERQSAIEHRQVALDALVEKARASGIEVASLPRLPRARPDAAAKGAEPEAGAAAPLGYMPSETAGGAQTDAIVEVLLRGGPSGEPHPSLDAILKQVQSSLDDGQTRQTQALDALSVTVEDEVERLSSALSPIGVQLEDADAAPGAEAPQGGPFVPASGLHFVERTAMLDRMLDDVGTLRRSAASLPLNAPLATQRVSSRFGYRIDPIEKKRAFHSGLDLVAPEGMEVHATAPGTVISAGWNGGYGLMVEIRHAGGVSTRYGHLSAALVKPGQRVAAGTAIGRVGSTGRSTGPHLHYETRRDGEAVNPSVFFTAARALSGS